MNTVMNFMLVMCRELLDKLKKCCSMKLVINIRDTTFAEANPIVNYARVSVGGDISQVLFSFTGDNFH
jgi:hypothetical protein